MDQNRHKSGNYATDISPLRSNQFKNPQPFQRQDAQQFSSNDLEEEEYNRRRQEGLRKQMQLSQHPQAASQSYQSNFSQPLRQKPGYDSPDANSLERQSIPERDRVPPSTHFTLGPQIKEEGPFEAPPHIREHIANIQNDNQSLMRRLNLVLQELDRVKREKEDLLQRLQLSGKEQSEISRMLNSEDNVDKVNKYMQDDLAYERDRNHKIKSQIKELDIYKTELIRELRKFSDQQDYIATDNQDQTYTLQQKLSQIQDLEKESYFTQEKIRALNGAIDDSQLFLSDENGDKNELQRVNSQLILERNDLLSRLEHLTRKYDECVKEISQDRAEMESHNKQHSKLITAKLIFQVLEVIQRDRLKVGFQEFNSYCQFDNKCHDKLKELSQILDKLGKNKLKLAMRQWFSVCLKPVAIKAQSHQFAIRANNTGLTQKMFARWRNLFVKQMEGYNSKTKAVKQIWRRFNKESQIEQKRTFLIWKETLSNFKQKQAKVKKLIWQLYFNQLNQAMNTWVNYNSNIDDQVRLQLLSKNFAQKQYLTVIYNSFKYQVTESKRKRLNILFHCLKSWKDHLQYQKFLMGTSVAALQFRKDCDVSIAKSCFDAWKHYKEIQKFQKVHKILHEEELPQVEQLTTDNENFIVDRKFKAKSQACETVKKLMSKQIYSYIKHWQSINEDYKEKLRTTVKDKVIQLYMETIRKAFNHWKVKNDQNIIQSQQMMIGDMQQEQQALQNEVMTLQKDVQQKTEQRDQCQKKTTLKCVLSFQKRLLQIAIGRWRDKINEQNVKEDGASTIVRRLRLRYIRQAFDLYLAGVKYQKKLITEEDKCQRYNKMRDDRLKRRVYNSWHLFRKNHTKAKEYWYRIYIRLDLSMKQTALKKWKEASQRNLEMQLEQEQDSAIEQVDALNHQIGELHIQETAQTQTIKEKNNTLTQQAQRIIANAFARFYYTNETRGLEKWKEYVAFEKKKERILKKYLDHMIKYQFYFVKSSFKNWMLNSDIQERKEQVKKEEMKVNDANFQLEQQTKLYDQTQQQLSEETEAVKQMQAMYSDRMQKTVKLIVNKVDANHFTGQKRYIFQQWREYVKREVAFINCIKNVIQKSLWSKGFENIKAQSRQVTKNDNLEVVLNKFRLKFWKRTCNNAFSVWRSGQFSLITSTAEEVEQTTSQIISDHQQRKELIKNNNMNRASRLLGTQNQRNLFSSWKNVVKFIKQQRIQKESCNSEFNYFWKRNALLKWQGRKQATKLARIRVKKLKEKFHTIRLRLFFEALKVQFSNTKEFCARLANLANIHDLQGIKQSFNSIRSFAKAKEFVFQKRKENSSTALEKLLNGIVMRRKFQHFTDLRLRCQTKKSVEWKKGFTIMYNIGNKLRFFFTQWKNGSDERTLAKEMHEEGPVREEVFEQRILFSNLVDLMQKEGYEEKDIASALNQEKSRQSQLILKSVRRMQHYNEDLYLKPKVFDKLKQFVQARRRFKYWLQFAEKRSQFQKSDLHFAFDKWKNFYANRQRELTKLSKNELDKMVVKNNNALERLADIVQNKENMHEHLNDQRESLVESYIKAQKLALAKWVNCQKQTLHQAFMRWNKIAKHMKNMEAASQLRKNLEFLDNLKNKIKELEHDNDSLATENEELRQFSLDGYEIARNVQALTNERELLSVDLADKSQMIRKLLDENEALTSKLRYAQDEAHSLIKSTMAGSSGFKTGKKGYSPLTRSANY